MRLTLALLGIAIPALSQLLIDESRLPQEYRTFEPKPNEPRLKCEVQPYRPILNFGFRFQAGYALRIPMNQFSGEGHAVGTMMRVTAEGRKPAYLLSGTKLPKVPQNTKAFAELGGSYVVGEGKYTVDFLAFDDQQRVCAAKWRVDAKRSRSERSMELRIEPGEVESLWTRHKISRKAAGGGPALTVLVNAAPLFWRSTRLRAFDQEMLMGTLATMLDLLPARSVRLVMFSLDQQKRLFSKDIFKSEDMTSLAQRLASVELGTVNYDVLQNRGGHLNLLADLINQELKQKPAPDAVVFLGPTSRYVDRFPGSALQEFTDDSPPFLYLRYKPYFGRPTPDFPDVVQNAVKAVKGRTFTVHTPAEFGKAIKEIEARLGN